MRQRGGAGRGSVEAGWMRCAEMGHLSSGQGRRLKLTKEGAGAGGHRGGEGRRGEGTAEGSSGEGGSRDADEGGGGAGRAGARWGGVRKVAVGHWLVS